MLNKILILLIFFIGLAGAGLTTYGAWLYEPPAGYITAGAWCMIASFLYSRALANNYQGTAQPPKDEH